MTAVGYSGTPLAKKLGIVAGSRVWTYHAPGDFRLWLEPMPEAVSFAQDGEGFDVAVLFVTEQEDLVARLPDAVARLVDRGGLWIAWPKKASRVPTSITEDRLREIILPTGLVDNKVCAISEVWSGLRFVRRRNPM